MQELGNIFKTARTKKKVTSSQAAAATRMKVQHIEALERGDFSRMAAPMYAKGFIKIYADYLGLDPTPLIKMYMDHLAPSEPVVQVPPSVIVPKSPDEEPPAKARWDFLKNIKWPSIRISLPRIQLGKPVWYGVLGAVVAAALVSLFLTRDRAPQPPPRQDEPLVSTPVPTEQPPTATPVAPVVTSTSDDSALLQDPPEPFIESPGERTDTP